MIGRAIQSVAAKWRALPAGAFLATMAVLTLIFIVKAQYGTFPALLSVGLIVLVVWAARLYRRRDAWMAAWPIATALLLWLAVSDSNFVLSVRESVLIALAGLGLVMALHQISHARESAAARLAIHNRFYKAIIENASDMIWLLDGEGVIRYLSPAALRLSEGGTSPEGRNVMEFVLPEDRAFALDKLGEALRRPGEMLEPFTLQVGDGQRQAFALSLAVRNLIADPAVGGIIANGRDVTQILRAEAALRDSEREYRQLYLAAADQARKLSALDQVRNAFTTVTDVTTLARTAASAVSAALRQIPVAVALLEGDRLGPCEVANGSEAWAASVVAADGFAARAVGAPNALFRPDGDGEVAVPLRDGERVVGVLFATGTSVLQITQSEADLMAALGERIDLSLTRLRLYRAIERERDFAFTIMETMDQPIAVGAPGGVFRYTNPAFERLVGRSREALLQLTAADIITPGDLAKAAARRAAALRGERAGEYEVQILRPGGETVPVRVRYASPAHAIPDGEVVAVLTDLTEARQREEALREANRTLEAARDEALTTSRMKSDFLATLSHEIRTPMNGILGMAELLLDTPLSRPQSEYASVIHQSGQALMEIINSILDYSRIEAGRMRLVPGETSIRGVVAQAVDLMRGTARHKRLALSVDIAPDTPETIYADEGRLRQVLLNLTGNAVKFTEAGSVFVSVKRSGPGRVRFSVADTGIGISPALSKRLFQPFTQGDPSSTREHGGTGLGLAISKSLVEMMGGVIGVHSDGESGAEFWFELPG